MKRKVYATGRERMIDQTLGFLAFPMVNVPLWIIFWIIPQWIDSQLLGSLVGALPWLVNGIVIVLAFLLRPQFGLGYIAFIAVALTLVAILSISFVAACFVTLGAAASFRDMGDQALISLFVFLMAAGTAVGLLGLGLAAIYVFWSWRSSD